MVNFGPLTAEIGPVVWGTPANFNGFRVMAALLHRTLAQEASDVCYREQILHHGSRNKRVARRNALKEFAMREIS